MKKNTTRRPKRRIGLLKKFGRRLGASFERFCLSAGVATFGAIMEQDAAALCGPRHGHAAGKLGR